MIVETARRPLISVQPETDLDVDLNCYRVSVLHRGLELPLPNCLDGFLIEPHAERPLHANIARSAIWPDDDPEQNRSLVLCVASLFRILRVRIVDRAGCGDP